MFFFFLWEFWFVWIFGIYLGLCVWSFRIYSWKIFVFDEMVIFFGKEPMFKCSSRPNAGLKGLLLEVGARRAPKLLLMFQLIWIISSTSWLSILTETSQKNVSFRALPKLPPPSHYFGQLVPLFRTLKTTFCTYDRKIPIMIMMVAMVILMIMMTKMTK